MIKGFVRRHSLFVDKFICFAVFIQSAISILQQILIFAFNVDPDVTTRFRVLSTALPMTVAILFSFIRKPKLFVLTYAVVFFILILHSTIFPENTIPIMREAPRFLLPVIIPSALCIMTIKNIDVVSDLAYFMAWISAILALVYVVFFFLGFFIIEEYNMNFTFSCLLPMLVLYNRKQFKPVLFSIFLFLVILAIGSRGGAIVFLLFILFDLFRSRSKFRWVVVLGGITAILLMPVFQVFIGSYGLSSRTLIRLESGEIATSAGREVLYPMFINLLLDNPIMGIGLYGDRLHTDNSYCHNLFLEIFLNYGIIIGTVIIVGVAFYFLHTYRKLKGEYRNLLLIFFFCGVVALMPSSSYLLNFNFALFIGYMVLMHKHFCK